MSKIEELDHRIGRHEGTTVKGCPLCHPEVAAANISRRWWDHEGPVAPAMPRYGDLWRESPLSPVMVFINPDPIWPSRLDQRKRETSGFWVDIRGGFNTSGDASKPLFLTPEGGAQIELTTGELNLRAEWIAVKNYIPAEAGRSAVLGVNLDTWARDQNFAKLVAMMQKEYLFPICEVSHDASEGLADLRTEIRSACLVIRLNDLKAPSDQMIMEMPF